MTRALNAKTQDAFTRSPSLWHAIIYASRRFLLKSNGNRCVFLWVHLTGVCVALEFQQDGYGEVFCFSSLTKMMFTRKMHPICSQRRGNPCLWVPVKCRYWCWWAGRVCDSDLNALIMQRKKHREALQRHLLSGNTSGLSSARQARCSDAGGLPAGWGLSSTGRLSALFILFYVHCTSVDIANFF